jgi:uncharacterized protein DUF4386
MTSRRTALACAIFTVTFVAGLLLVNNPDTDSSAETFVRYYSGTGNRAHLIAAAALMCIAALAWIVAVAGLRERVGDGAAGRVATTASAVAAALLGVCGTLIAVIPLAMSESGAPAPGADVARFVPLAGYIVLAMFAMPAIGLTVAAICVAALRTATLPRWLAWLGIAGSVLLLVSLFFFPMVVFVVWMVATAVVLARRPLRIPLPATA